MTFPFKKPIKISSKAISAYITRNKLANTAKNRQLAQKKLFEDAAKRRKKELPAGREITIQRTDAARRVVYGYCKVGGVYSFAGISDSSKKLHVVCTLAGHEIEEIEKVFVDEWAVDFSSFPGACTRIIAPNNDIIATTSIYGESRNGTSSQTAITYLVAKAIGWTSNHRQLDCPHIALQFTWDASLYGDSLPELSFRVKGKKCYDPRSGLTVWTRNAALIAADYITSSYGLNVPYSRIDEDALIDAADCCDESVTKSGGGTESRYTVDGYFDMDEEPQSILEKMAQAMAGAIIFTEGKWRIMPGKWRAPTVTLSDVDLRTDLRIDTTESRKDIFNRVRGTFPAEAQKWEVTDYPVVKNTTYESEDGEIIWEEINHFFTTSASAAQRISKIELEKNRQGIVVTGTWSFATLQLSVGDNVNLTFPRLGWISKPFEVQSFEIQERGNGDAPEIAVAMVMRETASGIFDWNSGMETAFDIAPNTNLPSAFQSVSMSGLALASGTSHLYIRADGTVFSRLNVSWTPVTNGFVLEGGHVDVQYKKSSASDWTSITSVDPNSSSAYILDVQDLEYYDVRIRAVAAIGTVGPWLAVFGHQVIGKTQPPSDVTGFQAAVSEYGVDFTWQKITDLDADLYEIRKGASWAAGELIVQVRGDRFKLAIQNAAGTFTYRIKAIDTSGNYSTNDATISVTISVPIVNNETFTIEGGDYVMTWASVVGSFAISEYILSYGEVYGSSAEIARIKTTSFKGLVTWANNRRFWIVAKDIAGNSSAAIPVDINILIPDAVSSFDGQVIHNQVLFKWSPPPTGTLPIAYYRIFKGAVFLSAEPIGKTDGTFSSYFEVNAGDYTYWIVAIDTAGNQGPERAIGLAVSAPNDFQLKNNTNLDFTEADVLTNIVVEGDFIRGLPVGGYRGLTEVGGMF